MPRTGCRSSGSSSSRTRTRRSGRRRARRSSASGRATPTSAFVLEGARDNGDIVSSRKGMMDLRFTIHGRAAHAGVEPHKGRSAVLEAAHKIVALHGLNGRWPGVTVNAGVVHGGTRPEHRGRRGVDPGRRAGGRAGALWSSPRTRSGTSPGHRPCPTSRPTSRSSRSGGRWRSSSGLATSSTSPWRSPARSAFRSPTPHRRRVGCQYDVGDGRAEPRRPGPGRRARPCARGIHRGPVDRPPHRAAREPDRGGRAATRRSPDGAVTEVETR